MQCRRRGRRSQPRRGSPVSTPHVDLNTLTVYELRARCHDAGLPETGRKAALVARLSNANQPPRVTVNQEQETPPGQHQGAESDPPPPPPPRSLQTERSKEPSSASSIAAFKLTARRRRRSTRSGLRHRTHPASALLRARRLLRNHRRRVGTHHRPSQHSRQARMDGHQLTLGNQQLPSPTASPVLSLPCLLAYGIASCEVSTLTFLTCCPHLCPINISSAPLHYPLAMDTRTPCNL